ncbi:tetratricopeptide repeat protein [Clostridium botulinum D/C]|uniref:tetratricopeptide repeat protein n=1 Tax=Clostridium botulinum TaxID=1491 RepID=UPI001E461F21|nr:tetratricopeptide repeat protein [Clostridium botulinum]MCD3350448.1 tetratricopeptide repeat protein [Clostridium botulinum D/C]MCD3359468.1 tetratricopeptide repeat protein [Clostridium botulinum D/C]MCD3363179.1 tetratricopeptide repeat protein [Clostridium botulinum D/C]MCD3365163.1 tetratricopeptide repeat protein [Clostridium botulinum D/C]
MIKIKKLYTKAFTKYERGYIDDAIDVCEEIMSLNMKHRPSINLKGLLYYFKGDLQSASALWKLNYEVNNDKVSKKYLDGLKEDEKIFSVYVSAIEYIRKNRFNDALDLLRKCKESDYNRINVDNNIATCYIKLGEYNKAVECVNRVLEIDVKNPIAIKNKKKLMKQGINKNFVKPRKSNLVFISVIVILLIGVGIASKDFVAKKIKNISKNDAIQENTLNKKNEKIKNKVIDKNITKVSVNEKFPSNALNKALESKDFNKIYLLANPWIGKKLDTNEKTILSRAEDILKDEGVKYFYNTGRECVESNDKWDMAIDNLTKAYDYGKDSYLYGHILFMLGVSYQNKQDVKDALKYYTEYDKKYPNENYIQEVLYRTTILYKNVDLNKAKEYGEKLLKNYPDCEYSNSKIKAIVSK